MNQDMETRRRKVFIITSLGKRYSGMIDVPSATHRTTDLLNSANIFCKNPQLRCYDNAILLSDAELFLDDHTVYKKFETIQIKLDDIMYFYDEFEGLGDEMEKKRALKIKEQTKQRSQSINIITRQSSGSFYDITGHFFGLFKIKSKNNFIPLTEVRIVEIFRKDDRWIQQRVKLSKGFIGVNNNHIESMTFSQWTMSIDSRSCFSSNYSAAPFSPRC